MDGHTPNPIQARMTNLEMPTVATDSNGETFTVFLNHQMPFRAFIEMTAEQAENIDAPKFKGKTEGGEIIGVTGSECLIFSPVKVLTHFVDITDLDFSIEWTDGLHPKNLEMHIENA